MNLFWIQDTQGNVYNVESFLTTKEEERIEPAAPRRTKTLIGKPQKI